jgi:Ca-activated chloride channel family protein
LSADGEAFQKVAREILSMEKKTLRSHEYSDYQQRYQIFLVIGLILLVTEIFIPEKRIDQAKESD